MTPLAIIQILYLAIKGIGIAVGLIWLCTAFHIQFIEKL